MENIIIAVDGPSGTGKGTIASHIAKHFGYDYLDTGLFYRSIAYLVLTYNIDLCDTERIIELANDITIDFKDNIVLINNKPYANELRSNEVNNIVSNISGITKVRLIINDKIRNYCRNKNVVVDGRDIATVVFPNANVKLYIDAEVDTRARRRFNQNIEAGIDCNFEDILENLKKRDKDDREHEFGALKMDESAILLDTTNNTVSESIEQAINIIEGELK